MADFVTLAVFDNISRAALAKAALEGSGIPCFLTNEHQMGIRPLNILPASRSGHVFLESELRVPRDAAEDAVELLRDAFPELLLPPDPLRREAGAPYCPKCGSDRLTHLGRVTLLLAAAVAILATIPFEDTLLDSIAVAAVIVTGLLAFFFRLKVRCKRCGHVWRS